MGKLTDLTNIINTVTDNDLVHFVDVDDPTQDPAGSSGKVTFADLRTSLDIPDSPDNVVIVKQESDFGTASGGEIVLTTNTAYQVSGSVIVSNTLVFPSRSRIMVKGSSYATDNIIYTGTGTLFEGLDGVEHPHFENIEFISATGVAKLWDIRGLDQAFSIPTYFWAIGLIIQNFGGGANLQNVIAEVFRRITVLQAGKFVFNNTFGISFTNQIYRNFVSTGQPFVEVLTNMNQGAFNEVAFIPAKGDSPFNVDPAIIGTSGLALQQVPYQGNVFGSNIAYEDAGGGQVRVICAGGISFDNGDLTLIRFTTNYNGVFAVSNVVPSFLYFGSIPAGSFEITSAFVSLPGETGQSVLLDGAAPKVEPFFKLGTIDDITSITDSGGLALFTTTGTAPTTGQSLYIDGTDAYDQGGFGVNVSGTTFNLLDSFGIPVPFVLGETPGNATFNTGSLDQTNNVVTASNTGGIIPDSQTLGNNILTTTVSFSSTTTLTRVSTGTWIFDELERFRATSDGRLIYTGKASVTVSFSAKAVVQRPSGGSATGFMNIMEKRVGAGSFTEIVNHPSSQNQVQSANASQLTVAAIVENINPGDEFGIGIATDASFTLNVLSIDFNIKK